MNLSRAGIVLMLATQVAMPAGCAQSDEAKAVVEPVLVNGKADVSQGVAMVGELPWGNDLAPTGSFSRDLEFHGYTFKVGADASVTIEITQKGSSKGLDSTLFLYGPQDKAGSFGNAAIAYDDDSGWGRLSRIKQLAVANAGTYLVVVGTGDGMGRGNYRLALTCTSSDCLPPPVAPAQGKCLPQFAAAIDQCIAGHLTDDPEWLSAFNRRNLVEQCSDLEIVAPALDELCADPQADASICSLSLEELDQAQMPDCLVEAWNRQMDSMCVFGTRYGELFSSGALVILGQRRLTLESPLTEIQQAQVLAALAPSAYSDVETLEQAFEAVDAGQFNETQIWDASNRNQYVAYEYGAGDNSYGMIFPVDSSQGVASIQDGDIYGCSTFWGKEVRDCRSTEDCAEGLSCVGVVELIQRGRCIDVASPPHAALDSACSAETPCPESSGLQCHGYVLPGDTGLCRPAWMTGHYEMLVATDIPDDGTAVEAQLAVFGLATVDVLVLLDLELSHPSPSDLTVTLSNPGGTEVTLSDGQPDLGELYLKGFRVKGFSGDESVNGFWRLSVRDNKGGNPGHIHTFGLTITSRWD